MKNFLLILFLLLVPWPAQAQVPTCVTALKATPQGPFPCSATLAWQDNSDNETTFIIERQLNGAPSTWQNIGSVLANVTTYVDPTLTQDPAVDNNYCYRVMAANMDSSGKPQYSAPSNVSCFLIPKKAVVVIPAPTAPSGLTTAAAGQTVIRLSWSDNSDNETGFDIERWTTKPTVTAGLYSVAADVVNWDNTGLTKGRTYCYRVRAKNNAGDSPFTGHSCATTNR